MSVNGYVWVYDSGEEVPEGEDFTLHLMRRVGPSVALCGVEISMFAARYVKSPSAPKSKCRTCVRRSSQ